MTFWEKITGKDMDKQMQAFDQQIATLPADYQAAWQQVSALLWGGSGAELPASGGSFSGRNLMPVLAGIVDLMTETASVGLSAEAALGSDLAGFVSDVTRESGIVSTRDHWRQQLNADVHRRLGR
ncbi:DUF1048 domain-containing protein [Lacticaseibacillus sp. GG6-2]